MTRIFNEIRGKEMDVPDAPIRVISFSPAITESLFMLSLGSRVIGVSVFCARPADVRKKRSVGSYNSVNIDLLRSLIPDLVFTATGYRESSHSNLLIRFLLIHLNYRFQYRG